MSKTRPYRVAFLAACAAAMLSAAPVPPAAAYPGDLVIMRGLDKVTARVSKFEAPVGVPVRFGTLRILVRKCDRTPPEEPPESAVLLDIEEIRPDEAPATLFQGWMFSSSPALSALEHPVYDVWVLECKKTAAPESDAKPATKPE